MSREYRTGQWQRVYGGVMHVVEQRIDHRRPPGDCLLCRGDRPHVVQPGIAEGEREHFAEHFARDFTAALSERRPVRHAHDEQARFLKR